MGLNPYIVFGCHFIGAIITLIIFYKTGEFESAVKYGANSYDPYTPSDVVFAAFVFWEVFLLVFVMNSISNAIDEFFRNIYKE